MKKTHFSCALVAMVFCFGCSKSELPNNDNIDKIIGTYQGHTVRVTTITTFAPGQDTTVTTSTDTPSLMYQVQRYNADTILLSSFHSIGELQTVYTGNNLTINTNWGVQQVTFTPPEGKVEVYDSATYVINGGFGIREDVTRFVGGEVILEW